MINAAAIIVIKDSPPHALESIDSVNDFVREIIIGDLDIGRDLKKDLSKNRKVRFVEVANVAYADVIKEDLKKETTCEYILYLDPDELFPTAAKRIIEDNLANYQFFNLPRKNIIFGKWIEHSRWWPDYQLRFFKRENVIWPKTVHPIPETTGNGYNFEQKEEYAIVHYNYDSLDQYLEKAVRYSKSEAQSALAGGQELTLHETIKKSLSEFISRFFAGEGYRDGSHGFVLAILQMFYYFLVYFYFWEQKKYFSIDEKILKKEARHFFSNGLKDSTYWENQKETFSIVNKIKQKIYSKLLP